MNLKLYLILMLQLNPKLVQYTKNKMKKTPKKIVKKQKEKYAHILIIIIIISII